MQKVDPNASFNLPSELKDQAKNILTDSILEIPGATEALDTYNMIKGQYYSYEDFRKSVESFTSKHKLGDYDNITQIPETGVYSQSVSNGFDSQEVTLYNPLNEPQQINLDDYYLAPEREDVQRVGVNRPSIEDPKLLSDLEKTLYEDMARLGIGFTPVVNDIADLYELLVGKDFISGSKLSFSDRMLSVLGVIAGSGAAYRYAKRVINSPPKYIKQFENGFEKKSKKPFSLNEDEINSAYKGLQNGSSKTRVIRGNYKNLKKSLELLKKNNVERSERRKIVEAFKNDSVVKKTSKDINVYRYSVEGKTAGKGNWVTKGPVKDPHSELALPSSRSLCRK